MPLNPCKGCTDRQIGCHGSCAAYTEWKAFNDEVRERKHSEQNLNRSISEILWKDHTPYKQRKR